MLKMVKIIGMTRNDYLTKSYLTKCCLNWENENVRLNLLRTIGIVGLFTPMHTSVNTNK